MVTVPPASFSPTAVTARPNRPSFEPPKEQEPPPRKPSNRLAYRAVALAILVAGGVAISLTDGEPSHPTIVSGRASPKVSANGATERWWKNNVTITLDGSLADLGAGAPDAVRGAFGTWLGSDVKLPKLRFDESGRKAFTLAPDGENRVYYAPITLPGHEKDLAITLAYSRDDTGEVTEADIVINAKQPFGLLEVPATTAAKNGKSDKSGKGNDDQGDDDQGNGEGHSSAALTTVIATSCTSTFDVQSVVTHEIGHFFGLGEDLTDASATMYYSTAPCDLGKRDLKTADTSEMSTLYAVTTSAEPEGTSGDSPKAAASCAVAPAGSSSENAPFVLGTLALGVAAMVRRRAAVR